MLVSLVLFIAKKGVEMGIDEDKEGEVGIGELMKEGVEGVLGSLKSIFTSGSSEDNFLSNFDIKRLVAREFKNGIGELKIKLESSGYKEEKLYDKLNNFDGTVKELDELFNYIDNDKTVKNGVGLEIKKYFKGTVLAKIKLDLEGRAPESILKLLDSFAREENISPELTKKVVIDELENRMDELVERTQVKSQQVKEELVDKIGISVDNVEQAILKEAEGATLKIIKHQNNFYYRSIEDGVIKMLIGQEGIEEGEIFGIEGEKKNARMIAIGGEVGRGSKVLEEGKVLKGAGYSTMVVEHKGQGIEVGSYKMGVNVTFKGEGEVELVYDVYMREVEGIHVIGLKLKENIDKELDTSENYAKAVLAFTKNVNNNSVLRNEFNTLKSKAVQMYGISSNLEISNKGISMINFEGIVGSIEVEKMLDGIGEEGEELKREGLKGVYITSNLEISQGTLQTIDEDIKAEEIFKLDEAEKFYQISVSRAKLDPKFIERAARVKIEQGATAIILDVTEGVDIMSEEGANKLLVALTAIHSLGLKGVMKVDMSKGAIVNEGMLKRLFELGFDGINMDGQEETDVNKIKEKLDILREASEKYAVGARNTIELKDGEVKEALKGSLGEKGFEGYKVLVITEVDNTSGEVKVDAGKIQKAINKGYERARRLGEMQIEVNASNLGVLTGLLNRKGEDVTAGQIREAVKGAGIRVEVVKHIEKVLKGAGEEEEGTERVLEALGFARGLVEATLVNRYMSAFDFTQEVYNMNSITDRQALGIVLVKGYLASPEKFASKEALRDYFKEAEDRMIQESSASTFEEQRGVMARYVNSITNEIEISGMIESKKGESREIAISLAVLNSSINKISFNRIIEDAKRRTKVSTNAVKSILGAA
jgi:hypothetical protein